MGIQGNIIVFFSFETSYIVLVIPSFLKVRGVRAISYYKRGKNVTQKFLSFANRVCMFSPFPRENEYNFHTWNFL